MKRNSCHHGVYSLTPVEDFSIFRGFSCLSEKCEDRDLDEFIHHDAYRHHIDKIAITYVLTSSEYPSVILGFVTLQNDAIVIPDGEDLPDIKGHYSYRSYPAVRIGRLGINYELQKQKLGSILLYLVKKLMTTDNRTGCRFLTADAWRNKKYKVNVFHFYVKNGFSLLALRPKTSSTIPVYFDLATFEPLPV